MRSSISREVAIALESGVECKGIRKASGQGQDPDRTQGIEMLQRNHEYQGFEIPT